MTLEIRPLTASDGAAFAAFIGASEARGDLTGSAVPIAGDLARFAQADPRGIAIAIDDDRIEGFVATDAKALVVEPVARRQGIGRRLVAEGIAMERARGRANLILGPRPGDLGGPAFLDALGFAYHSTVWDLRLEADVAVPAPVWPAGITVRAYARETDAEAWIGLFNAAFADHATPLQMDAETIRAAEADPAVQDADVCLAFDQATPDAPIGFCATDPRRTGDARMVAEIWTIGVHPSRQGQGLGRQLLRWGVAHLRAVGAGPVGLSVNGRNEGALGLYESERFTRTHTRDRWACPVA